MIYLGIDTSNYTTSAAIYDSDNNAASSATMPLPVPDGALGLRQSEALFFNIKQMPRVLERLNVTNVAAVGVSTRPRDIDGSYMPCFLAGESVAGGLASVMRVPLCEFSHQQGHIAAAAWSSGHAELLDGEFLAWHASGGTTELLHVENGNINIIGGTLDISAGQLVDRVGKLLGLPFPAGQAMDELACGCEVEYHPPIVIGRFFNLSGYENKAERMLSEGERPENIAAFTLAVIQRFLENATPDNGLPLLCAGGVMRNSHIRKAFENRAYFAAPEYSSDNALGVAYLAYREGRKQ